MSAGRDIRVRRAAPADAAAIIALEQLFPGDRMSARSVRRFLRAPAAAVWVAQRRATVVGALVMATRPGARFARIYSVVVSPAARGRGLGLRLVRTAEREARRRGCDVMSLEVRADNRAAQALYAALGYGEHARLRRYYEDGCDGLRLRKQLSA